MSKSSKHRSSSAILQDISAAGNTARRLRQVHHGTVMQAKALDDLVIAQTASFVASNGSLDSVQAAQGAYRNAGSLLAEAAGVAHLVTILAADPDTAAAIEVLDPLFAELEAAEASELAEKQLADQLEASRLEALAQAKREALAEIEKRFSIA